jgi:hypothetical protein
LPLEGLPARVDMVWVVGVLILVWKRRVFIVTFLSQVGYSMGLPRQRGELSSNVTAWQGAHRELLRKTLFIAKN